MFWTDNSPELKFFSGRDSRRFGIIGQKSFRREKIFLATQLPMDWRNQFWRKPVLGEVDVDQLYIGFFWRNFARIGTQFFKKNFQVYNGEPQKMVGLSDF